MRLTPSLPTAKFCGTAPRLPKRTLGPVPTRRRPNEKVVLRAGIISTGMSSSGSRGKGAWLGDRAGMGVGSSAKVTTTNAKTDAINTVQKREKFMRRLSKDTKNSEMLRVKLQCSRNHRPKARA